MWRSLNHKFVLPFLGIYESEPTSQFFVVTPFMMNGTLSEWRKKANRSTSEIEDTVWLLFIQIFVDTHSLWKMLEVAQGMEYIHSEGVIHGDLRGVFNLKYRTLGCWSFSVRITFFWTMTFVFKSPILDWLDTPNLLLPNQERYTTTSQPQSYSDIPKKTYRIQLMMQNWWRRLRSRTYMHLAAFIMRWVVVTKLMLLPNNKS